MNIYIPKKMIVAVCLILAFYGALLVGLNVSRNLMSLARENYVFEVPRDAIVAVWAHRMAGEMIPPDEIDYNEPGYRSVWGQYTNSMWMSRWGRLIVPYMDYENINPYPNYPKAVLITPIPTERSMHLAAYADVTRGILAINERFVVRYVADVRQILALLTHELTHFQGGHFHDGPSHFIESRTNAATVELLAAMCNYREPLACRTFWYEIEDMADASLRVNLTNAGYGQAYEWFARVFLYEEEMMDYSAHRKSMRYWAKDPVELDAILTKYGQIPWIHLVIPGVLGESMGTGNPEWNELGFGVVEGMAFDDTRDAMGFLFNIIRFFEITLKGRSWAEFR